MRYAVFSDVHSNYEALKTFLIHTDSIPDLERICLGDIVGYSSRPNECIHLLREREIPIVMGNHDCAIYSNDERSKFNPVANQVIEWQSQILIPDYRKFLFDLPLVYQVNDLISIAHGDFSSPQDFLYVTAVNQARRSMNAMTTPIGFFGHTHIPTVFVQYPERPHGEDITGKVVQKDQAVLYLDPNARYLINPGSLGQPRDGTPQSSFVILNTDDLSLTFHRFEYNYMAETKHILDMKLPAMLADRIIEGY